jgi:hypothetical protein
MLIEYFLILIAQCNFKLLQECENLKHLIYLVLYLDLLKESSILPQILVHPIQYIFHLLIFKPLLQLSFYRTLAFPTLDHRHVHSLYYFHFAKPLKILSQLKLIYYYIFYFTVKLIYFYDFNLDLIKFTRFNFQY